MWLAMLLPRFLGTEEVAEAGGGHLVLSARNGGLRSVVATHAGAGGKNVAVRREDGCGDRSW